MKYYILILLSTILFSQLNFKEEKIKLLDQKHQNLLLFFKDAKKQNYEEQSIIINDDESKKEFYNLLEVYNLTLSLALSNPDFILNTPLDEINNYKNDSKYFSGLKSYLNKGTEVSVVNTYKFQDTQKYTTVEDDTFDTFKDNHVVYFKYGRINKFGYSNTADTYDFGNSFDIMLYHPKEIKLFDMDFILSYKFNLSNIPSVGTGKDLSIQKMNIHLLKYLERLPLYFDLGIGPSAINKNLGLNCEFILSYYIPIQSFDLSFNLSYEQYVDVQDDFNLIFGYIDLIGINLTVGKGIVIK